jgi:hypothetical protein
MSKSFVYGRLGNQFFTHLAASLFAEKHNLCIEYENYENVGIDLFFGEKKYDTTIVVDDNNYIELYNRDVIDFNVHFKSYFQSKKVTDLTHPYLMSKMNTIIEKNMYKNNYNNNNDCFVHVRLGDVATWNPGANYYNKIISTLDVDTIYISSDNNDSEIIKELLNNPKTKLVHKSPLDTILFGSTNKYIICSHGTFSGMMSYLSFFSTVFFIHENETTSWDFQNGNHMFDIFSGKSTTIGKFIETI